MAADTNFVFWGTPGNGILKSGHGGGGNGSYTTFLPEKIITGLFAKDGKLYVSNFSDGKIHVYDIATMTEDLSAADQAELLKTIGDLNRVQKQRYPLDQELESRIANYELAARMQVEAMKVAGLDGDELGYADIPEFKLTRSDIHATIQHLVGLDFHRNIFAYEGRDESLVGVTPARVIEEILA